MEKQKLLVFSDCYIYGGSERLMSFLVKNEHLNEIYEIAFAFRNHKIYRNDMARDFDGLERKLNPVTLLSNETIFYKINKRYANGFLRKILKFPFLILKRLGIYTLFNSITLFNLLRKQDPDVLHINNGGFPAAASCNLLVFIAKAVGVKNIVYQVNNQAQKKTFFTQIWINKLQQFVKSFITASNMAKENLSNNVGIKLSKIKVIKNVVKANVPTLTRKEIQTDFRLSDDPLILVHVAFLTKRKGQIYLLKALKILLERNVYQKNIFVFFIGDGEDEQLLKSYCYENDLSDKVRFLGYRPNYADFINAADIVVFPSISNEDLPLVIVESLMLGKCILGTSLAGIAEVITNGENGILISPDINDLSERLGEQISRLAVEKPEIIRLGEAAKKSSIRFSEYSYASELKKVYQE